MQGAQIGTGCMRQQVSAHGAWPTAHAGGRYLESVRRYNYTTPKSYLELISLYKALLAQKRAELRGEKERLESGVDKISQASAQARAFRPPWPFFISS